ATSSEGTPSTPSALAARFAAVLATTVGAPAAGSSPDSGTSAWNGSGFGTSRDPGHTLVPARSNANQATLSLGSIPSVSTQTQAQAIPPATPALPDPSAIVEQVVKGMTMRSLANGTSEIRLRLFPENLGEISMKLTVQGSSVNASIVAQNGTVQSALVNGHQQLARSLNEAGLTLSGFSVDVSGGDAGNGGSKDRASGFGRHYVIHELPGSQQAIAATDPSSSPPIVNGSTLELFNYLV
ncbi:MAG: flagellar hook-length control protein FliK, partial [Vulcanimicrobiaceae bacterium]